jgi:hypothetical protein
MPHGVYDVTDDEWGLTAAKPPHVYSVVCTPTVRGSLLHTPVDDWRRKLPALVKRPRALVIRSNTDRTSRQTVLLNPLTSQTFNDVLTDVTNMLRVRYPPVMALYTAKSPYQQVRQGVFADGLSFIFPFPRCAVSFHAFFVVVYGFILFLNSTYVQI